MKFKNILFTLLVALVAVLGVTVNAESTAPGSYTVRFRDLHRLSGGDYFPGMNYHFYYKVNSDGKVIYCMQRKNDVVDGTETYYLSEELDAKYAYVMENGYPNKSLTGNNDEDYYITGLAIWYLINPSDSIFANFDIANGTYRGQSNTAVQWINKLVSGAASYSYTDPTLKLNAESNKLHLTEDGKYYRSDAITISASGTTGYYSIKPSNAPKGTTIVNKDGSEFTKGLTFYVQVPVKSINQLSTEFSVVVSGSGTINKAYLYTPTHSRFQTTATIYPETKYVNDSVKLNIEKISKVVISKQDATTGEELPGAHLELKDETGEVIYAWVSTNEPFIIKDGLKPGKYTLSEMIAPEGYELSTETVTFVVKEDGTVDGEIIMYNKPETIEVPNTSSFKTITASLIGVIIIGLGSFMIYRNYKKNEEK